MMARGKLWKLVLITSAICWSTACWTDPRVMWSPDGRHAAVIGAGGLRLTNETGSLSPLLVPGVSKAAWFADSKQLVLVVRRELTGFSSLSAALGPERTKELGEVAEIVWQQLQAPAGPLDAGDRIFVLTGLGATFADTDDVETAIGWYLLEHHRDAIRQKLGEEADLDELPPITVNSLVVARLIDDRLELGRPLYSDIDRFMEIRPAPAGQAVAFVTATDVGIEGTILTTRVVGTDGAETALIVDTETGSHFDWGSDGRSLWYFQALDERDLGKESWGVLTERKVLDADGEIELAESGSSRVRVPFSRESRVRSLADGRVMFNAPELRLPAVLAGEPTPDHEQLFAFDRKRSTLTALVPTEHLADLPPSLAVFEPGPDADHFLIGGGHGDVWLICISDDRLEHVETGFEVGDIVPMPSWRTSDEFLYVRKAATRAEFVLRRGDAERILSADWPAQVLKLK
jgi:hypothetical protein